MKPFGQLTRRGQATRLLALARTALAAYPIHVRRVRFLAKHTNTLFRVDAGGGTRYLLRVCAPGEHSLRDHQIEAMWLDALGKTDIPVPRLVADRNGQLITHATADGVPDGRRCMLFSWVPGRRMEVDKSLENFSKLGTLLARIHSHATGLYIPEDMRPVYWDKTFYFPSDPVVVYEPSYESLFAFGQIKLIQRAEHRVNATLSQMHTLRRPHLIHGDLHTNNVHVHKGELYAIDFEDVLWGFPAQDIAVSLYDARYHCDDFAAVRDALRHGYESVAEWPIASERLLETLLAARMLMFINYRMYRGGVDLGTYVPRMMARVEAFVDS
jgi:Ser/Thr protein kinase RdoA (MazF antagonist)